MLLYVELWKYLATICVFFRLLSLLKITTESIVINHLDAVIALTIITAALKCNYTYYQDSYMFMFTGQKVTRFLHVFRSDNWRWHCQKQCHTGFFLSTNEGVIHGVKCADNGHCMLYNQPGYCHCVVRKIYPLIAQLCTGRSHWVTSITLFNVAEWRIYASVN